jgi:ADP-heptose:LPS heptosyltransferase
VKVLLTRTDRLGDLVLSLPVIADIARERPGWELHAMVAPAAAPLVENDPGLRAVWTWPQDGAPDELEDLRARLAHERFDAAVMLLYDARLARLLRDAGIGRRYGPLSKWSSWRLLNRGSWQRRSHGADHEMVHNLRLGRRLTRGWLRGGDGAWPEPRIHLGAGQREIAAAFRSEAAPGAHTVAFVHPGSGGSALDWPPERFAAVANALALQPGWKVFVTGSGTDAAAVAAMGEAGLERSVEVLLDRHPLREFLGVLAAGDVFVGPSTGPLHMAAALDLATVGVFPPVPAMSPARWGQRGRWNRILVPDVRCPGRRVCLKERCMLHNCLRDIPARQVAEAADAASRERRRDLAAGSDRPERTEHDG